jgi:membrane associated rhomboid family serine protease
MSQRLYRAIVWPAVSCLFIWGIFLLSWFAGTDWGVFGIYPRTFFGLRGIVLAPFLHGDWGHLIANTPPLLALLAMTFYFYPRVAGQVILISYLLTGIAIWLFARPVFHIGASGVIYALVAFLAWNGLFRKNIRAVAIALVVIFYYGGMFAGILPMEEDVSWESHLLGGLVGIFAAFLFRERIEQEEQRRKAFYETEDYTEETEHFLPPDTFELTKRERNRVP